MKKILLLLSVFALLTISAAEYKISNIKISAGKSHKFAAEELKKHLELSGNKLIPGEGALQVIIGTAGVKGALKPGEARWLYKGGKLYFWGDDRSNRNGTLFAVYDFLDAKLGARWFYPGEDGIFVPQRESISLKENESGTWIPSYLWGYVRGYRWGEKRVDKVNNAAPPALRIDQKKWKANNDANRIFLLRHRHTRTFAINYAHAFGKWPKRFAKTHMDYFGVSPYGKPQIPANPRHAKLCLSNPKVIDQIIADYKARKAPKYLNVSPNDGTPGFCHCANCMALDTRKPGESFYDHLTDRYLNFWNRIIKRAIALNPEVMVTTYVYSYYRFPPRREKIEYPDNMLCGLVPQLGEDSRALFEAWKAVGMKHCFLRPNDLCHHSAEMRFMEKRIYDKYQETSRHFKLWGADYDASLSATPIDMESYVACRMIALPGKSFEEIAAEYYSGFGAAGDLVRSVYETLRPYGEAAYLHSYKLRRRTMLDDSELESKPNTAFNTAQQEQLKRLNAYPADKLDPGAKKRFEKLKLVLEHSIIAGKFLEEGAKDIAGQKNDFTAAAKALMDFRTGKGKALNEMWGNFFNRKEKAYWNRYQPYRDSTGNDLVKLADPAAGWRNSFDAPSMQEWRPRQGFLKITNAESSFDRYSIECKPVQKNTVLMNRSGIEVTPGAEYTLTFDAKAPHGASFRLRVNAGKKTLANIGVNVKSQSWQQASGKFTIPDGVEKVTMYLYIAKAPKGGFIDNIVLTRLKK